MNLKTRGIVLNYIKYGDSSLIVRIYTEKEGPIAFIVKGIRNKKSKLSISLFNHLSLVDIDFEFKTQKNLQIPREIKSIHVFETVPFDVRKNTLAIFISEVLYKALKEHESNKEVFDFIFDSILHLDLLDDNLSVYHIYFLLQLSSLLGFYPLNNFSTETTYFDLTEGSFTSVKPMHTFYLNRNWSTKLSMLIELQLNQIKNVLTSKDERLFILENLLLYYQLHLPNFKEVKSFAIYKELFS